MLLAVELIPINKVDITLKIRPINLVKRITNHLLKLTMLVELFECILAQQGFSLRACQDLVNNTPTHFFERVCYTALPYFFAHTYYYLYSSDTEDQK